jgi:hypothetical protein
LEFPKEHAAGFHYEMFRVKWTWFDQNCSTCQILTETIASFGLKEEDRQYQIVLYDEHDQRTIKIRSIQDAGVAITLDRLIPNSHLELFILEGKLVHS